MELWTEYEGRTIDGAFRLTKLIRPEGRSAFFSTSNGSGGTPTVIRLIESHFDDDEILARWRGVQALDHANLVKLKSFGQVMLDETSLVYAVMEPVEANLSQILGERRLTAVETRQVANSLVAALKALHANGFVHEHVEPAHVFAVGEDIKLRSDCIRETPEGEEGSELKRWDVYDLAVVVLQALTQHKTLEEAERDLPLAAPFDEIVRKGMNGEWGLTEIALALNPVADARPIARPVTRPAVPHAAEAERTVATLPEVPVMPTGRARLPLEEESRGIEWRRLVIGVGAMLLLLLVWFFVHGRAARPNGAVQPVAPPVVAQGSDTAATQGAPAAAPETSAASAVAPASEVAPAAEAAPAARVANAPSGSEVATAGDAHGQWRVVAFTYNREAQAQQKAASIAAKHPKLKPEVFTPNGHAPYLVTVGGAMSRDKAFALVARVKREGLPRDSYAQSYRGAGR